MIAQNQAQEDAIRNAVVEKREMIEDEVSKLALKVKEAESRMLEERSLTYEQLNRQVTI